MFKENIIFEKKKLKIKEWESEIKLVFDATRNISGDLGYFSRSYFVLFVRQDVTTANEES